MEIPRYNLERNPARIGKTVNSDSTETRELTGESQYLSKETEQSTEPDHKISRRDFLKYSAGVAAVAAGATAMMGKIPLPFSSSTSRPNPTAQGSTEAMVVTVHGDELTLISGEKSVKVKDATLAAALASAGQSEE